MTYPVRVPGILLPADGSTHDIAFRPSTAGLVNVILTGSGRPANTDGGASDNPDSPHHPAEPFKPFTVAVQLDIYGPDRTKVLATGSCRIDVDAPGVANQLLLAVGAMAEEADLTGDWSARITNPPAGTTSNWPIVPADCDVTVRYQVVPGNLGKIDHFVVVMMENRSFDHMLGYLSLPVAQGGKGRSDIDGLTGSEFNLLGTTKYPVHLRQSTNFRSDPGHGVVDVAEQLGPDGGGGLVSNAGFVTNFASQHEKRAETHTVVIPPGQSSAVAFGPVVGGTISFELTPRTHLAMPAALSGAVGSLGLREASGTDVVAHVAVDPARGATLTFDIGDNPPQERWACAITNSSGTPLTYDLTIGFRGLMSLEDPGAVMSYYTADALPVYDMLAENFAICDRWYCSIPTETWPNRLYALAGGSAGMQDAPHTSDVEAQLPGYTLTTIFEPLRTAGVDYGIFFSGLPFELVFTRLAQDAHYTAHMRGIDDFERRAKDGSLPAFSWVEPTFYDIPRGDVESNDDHPPCDITPGQNFVARIYNAVASGPGWPKTALIITYDEHGGFFDHVLPPGNGSSAEPGPPADVESQRQYGPRVPTFVISPWVKPGAAAHDVYDHTSVLASLLHRFCRAPDGTVPSMGPRTDAALDIDAILSEAQPTLEAPQAAMSVNPSAGTRWPEPASEPFGRLLDRTLLGF